MRGFWIMFLSLGLMLAGCATNDNPDSDLGMQDPVEDNEELTSEDEDGLADGNQMTDVNDGPDESGEDPDKPQDRDETEGADYEAQNDDMHDKVNEMRAERNSELYHGVIDFELEIEFFNDQGEWNFEYAMRPDGKKAEIEIDEQSERDRKGRVAVDQIEAMIDDIQPTPELSKEEAFQRVYDHLKVMEEEVREIELDVDFDNGDTLEVEHTYR
ncbi:hypothetical protein ABID56_000866 [Alkalibacillus flavidus]|uniref:YusW-like protein n=1 Tax=Alkalibacillus flavidus TaxID=546021 RepID=A0ABV2KT65_9BACI